MTLCCIYYRPRNTPLLPLIQAADAFRYPHDASFEAGSAALGLTNDLQGGNGANAITPSGNQPLIHIELHFNRMRRRHTIWNFNNVASVKGMRATAAIMARIIREAKEERPLKHQKHKERNSDGSNSNRDSTGGEKRASKLRRILSGAAVECAAEISDKEVHEGDSRDTVEVTERQRQESPTQSPDQVRMGTPRVCPHIEGIRADWRMLSVEIIWGASTVMGACIGDPLEDLDRRIRDSVSGSECPQLDEDNGKSISAETEQLAAPQERAGTNTETLKCEDANTVEDVKAPGESKKMPCFCGRIGPWQWRAVGCTAYFGEFTDTGCSPLTEGFKGNNEKPTITRSGVSSNEELKSGSVTWKNGLELRLSAMLQAALQFAGLPDPANLKFICFTFDEKTSEPRHMHKTLNTSSALISGGMPKESNAAVYQRERNLSVTLPNNIGVACFPRRCYSDSSKRRFQLPKLEQVFYVVGLPHTFSASTSNTELVACDRTNDKKGLWDFTSDGDLVEQGIHRDWCAFSDQLLAKAATAINLANNNCGGCAKETSVHVSESLGYSNNGAYMSSSGICARVWHEYNCLLHCYLAAISGCCVSLRFSCCFGRTCRLCKNVREYSLKGKNGTVPMPPSELSGFLRRVIDAYDSRAVVCCPCGALDLADHNIDNKQKKCDAAQGVTTVKNGEEVFAKCWTADELMHWQFSCSICCNTGMRILVANHVIASRQN